MGHAVVVFRSHKFPQFGSLHQGVRYLNQLIPAFAESGEYFAFFVPLRQTAALRASRALPDIF